jgi:hypothetical protein
MLEKKDHSTLIEHEKHLNNRVFWIKKHAYSFLVWFITIVYALKSSIVTVVALSAVSFLAPMALPGLMTLLICVFVAEFITCIFLYRKALSDTLIAFFITGIFNKAATEEKTPAIETPEAITKNDSATVAQLTFKQKIWVSAGLITSVAGGLAIASYGYLSVVHLIGVLSVFFSFSIAPPATIAIAIFIATIGFIAFSGLLIKKIRQAIINDSHIALIHFFRNFFERDAQKSPVQHGLECFFKAFFLVSMGVLGCLAFIVTLGTLNQKLFSLFALIPDANVLACKIASAILVYGLTACAKLPWVFKSVGTIFVTLGEKCGYAVFCFGNFLIHNIRLFFGENLDQREWLIDEKLVPESDTKEYSLYEKILEVITIFGKIAVALLFGFSCGARVEGPGGDLLEDLFVPSAHHDDAFVKTVTHGIALAAQGLFQIPIGAYELFFQKQEKEEEVMKRPKL